jgi:ATP-dependent helicase HrpB
LCIAQLDAGQKDGKIFLAAAVDIHALLSLGKQQETVVWDDEREMVAAFTELRFDNVVLERKQLPRPSSDKSEVVLLNRIREKGLNFLEWQPDQLNWQARLMSLKHWRPTELWPDVTDEALLNTLEDWLAPYLNGLYKKSELLKLDWQTILQSSLPWTLAAKTDQLAPEKILVPSGSMIGLQYFTDGRPPVMEVRLQEMFGLLETPTVNDGRNKIRLHLLSPGYKPVQVTQDLKSFWQTTYHEVRKELRMRYPKHHWPEDPWTAEAVRGVKKKPKP